jgi:hypothetical protein
MKSKICVPPDMLDSLGAFVESEGLPLEPTTCEDCALRVVHAESGVESDLSTLQAGGWIECAVAWRLAGKLGTSTAKVGELLDFLDIKIRKCALGCF